MAKNHDAEIDEHTRRIYEAEGGIKASYAAKGRELAKREGYGDLHGIDAIHRYLIEKYHWLPKDVRALTVDDLQLLLAGVDLNSKPTPKARVRTLG